MDSQRWVCRIHLFQFNVTSSEKISQKALESISPQRSQSTPRKPFFTVQFFSAISAYSTVNR
jgi:hypothetical protein